MSRQAPAMPAERATSPQLPPDLTVAVLGPVAAVAGTAAGQQPRVEMQPLGSCPVRPTSASPVPGGVVSPRLDALHGRGSVRPAPAVAAGGMGSPRLPVGSAAARAGTPESSTQQVSGVLWVSRVQA